MSNIHDRRCKLARRLALWSISDHIDNNGIKLEIEELSKNAKNQIEKINSIQEQIYQLEQEKKNIVDNVFDACSKSILKLQEKTQNSTAKPLIDLAFWNQMSESTPEVYNLLHPYLNKIGDEEEKK